jgi:hypothetical protein
MKRLPFEFSIPEKKERMRRITAGENFANAFVVRIAKP